MCRDKHLRNQGSYLGQHIELRETADALTESIRIVQHALCDGEIDQRIGDRH